MRHSETKRSYDFIMSLGWNCMVAYQLKRMALRKFSGPLDWVMTNSTDQVIRLLNNRFNGYMEQANLQILDKHNGFYSVEEREFQVYSFHDFPVSDSSGTITNYAEFKELLNRRINRFLERASQCESALFVRENCSLEDAVHLKAALSSLVKGTAHLLVINHTTEMRMMERDWGIDGVSTIEIIRSDMDEKIRDPFWNEAFQGIYLKP